MRQFALAACVIPLGLYFSAALSIYPSYYLGRVLIRCSARKALASAMVLAVVIPNFLFYFGLIPIHIQSTNRLGNCSVFNLVRWNYVFASVPIESKRFYLLKHLMKDLDAIGFEVKLTPGFYGLTINKFDSIAIDIIPKKPIKTSANNGSESATILTSVVDYLAGIIPKQCGNIVDVNIDTYNFNVVAERCVYGRVKSEDHQYDEESWQYIMYSDLKKVPELLSTWCPLCLSVVSTYRISLTDDFELILSQKDSRHEEFFENLIKQYTRVQSLEHETTH